MDKKIKLCVDTLNEHMRVLSDVRWVQEEQSEFITGYREAQKLEFHFYKEYVMPLIEEVSDGEDV